MLLKIPPQAETKIDNLQKQKKLNIFSKDLSQQQHQYYINPFKCHCCGLFPPLPWVAMGRGAVLQRGQGTMYNTMSNTKRDRN